MEDSVTRSRAGLGLDLDTLGDSVVGDIEDTDSVSAVIGHDEVVAGGVQGDAVAARNVLASLGARLLKSVKSNVGRIALKGTIGIDRMNSDATTDSRASRATKLSDGQLASLGEEFGLDGASRDVAGLIGHQITAVFDVKGVQGSVDRGPAFIDAPQALIAVIERKPTWVALAAIGLVDFVQRKAAVLVFEVDGSNEAIIAGDEDAGGVLGTDARHQHGSGGEAESSD